MLHGQSLVSRDKKEVRGLFGDQKTGNDKGSARGWSGEGKRGEVRVREFLLRGTKHARLVCESEMGTESRSADVNYGKRDCLFRGAEIIITDPRLVIEKCEDCLGSGKRHTRRNCIELARRGEVGHLCRGQMRLIAT